MNKQELNCSFRPETTLELAFASTYSQLEIRRAREVVHV
jgi:hypothetical protein